MVLCGGVVCLTGLLCGKGPACRCQGSISGRSVGQIVIQSEQNVLKSELKKVGSVI